MRQNPCEIVDIHETTRYTEGSAAWVLIASIIVFFMVSFNFGEDSFCNRPLWFPESWIHAVGGCLCKNSEGEEIRCCTGEMKTIFVAFF